MSRGAYLKIEIVFVRRTTMFLLIRKKQNGCIFNGISLNKMFPNVTFCIQNILVARRESFQRFKKILRKKVKFFVSRILFEITDIPIIYFR